MKFRQSLLILSLSAIRSACGGSSGNQAPPPPGNFAIGGSVTGLSGTGLVLQDNGGANLSVTANGIFTFASRVTALGPYNVTVLTQPSTPTQLCTVTGGSGTASSDITTVLVTCVSTVTIGGTVSGLTGSGLVLQNNSADNLSIAANGTFTFATPITSGGAYAVTILTQPSSPTQACTVTDGSGNANNDVTHIAVSCATSYTIGGSVSGLTGSGLVLQDNGTDNLAVAANGAFTFSKPVTSYNVSVFIEPSGPQTCVVTNGSGTATADVTNVQVTCTAGISNEWTWMGGDETAGNFGVYGTKGVAAPTNLLGGRSSFAFWIDGSGALWVFGGKGLGSTGGKPDFLSDLWKYSNGEWTWMSGPEVSGQAGVYGTLGVSDPANFPGGRTGSIGWIDATGNLWLFGGFGLAGSGGGEGELNDLWKYSAGEWTWMGGSSAANQVGTYGTQGTADPNNIPGARDSYFGWTDSSGTFWLFGGDGYDSKGVLSQLSDLWKFSAGQWTWVGGPNTANQVATYGTKGVASASNTPGARDSGMSAIDSVGNLWLFGGRTQDSTESIVDLNDLWEYSAGQWKWVSGSNSFNAVGVYGTKGVAAPDNVPGARRDGVAMADPAGSFWLFGGGECLNDLWKFSNGEWTWVSGSSPSCQPGIYGTLGVAAPGNVSGSRGLTAGWSDSTGSIWFFGGNGIDVARDGGNMNDLWKYTP